MKRALGSILFVGVAGIAACALETGRSESDQSTTQAATSCAALYYQCGGIGFAGPNCCVNSTCQYQNPYYSQCLPSSCPSDSGNDAQLRAAASIAFDLMRLAAAGQLAQPHAFWVYSVLASQRYRIQSGGGAIEFDPTDPLYGHVTDEMKARLAIAQLDSTVAQFLVAGQQSAYSTIDGWRYASVPAAQGLDGFVYPGPKSNQLLDIPSGNYVDITGQAWCQTAAVTFHETSTSTSYAPLIMHDITNWRSGPPPGYTGTLHKPASPFNGASAAGNPYLIVSVNGQTTTWANYSFAGQNCTQLPNGTCTGTLVVDPIPYTQPADYYDDNGTLVGPQSNPFALQVTNIYADSAHAGQWATRVIGGVQQWGTFSKAVTVLGTTVYGYVKQM